MCETEKRFCSPSASHFGFQSHTNYLSSLPVLRKLSILREGMEFLQSENSLSMLKVWLALEVREFIHASVQDVSIIYKLSLFFWNFLLTSTKIHHLVKVDGLSPNY